MDKSLKELLVKNFRFTTIIVLVVTVLLLPLLGIKIAFAYFIGAILGLINFMSSGIIMGKYFLKKPILINIGYILRILLIILVAIPFTNDLIMFLAYLGGFISHHICLIFYWIFIKERK
ncbi:hypothetical protein [Clostridium intestinale]|jgi:hypothetical protein|uniref:hypothetical protein n=1 Tax=Clostridium intestinale TaxID=36845 RepID=UPI002DD66F73|nr:hypothetical protein [Clostridium intestinale]WRY49875.1 hypothetical protein P8F83_14260 [Clostridium intestinale]